MADTEDKDGKGDITDSSLEVTDANETSNASFLENMDVDSPTLVQKESESPKAGDNGGVANKKEKSVKVGAGKIEDDEFLVVEEDDGDEDEVEGHDGNENTAQKDETFKTPEPMEAEEKDKGEEPEIKVEKEELLANPLFGKPDGAVPVINIESSDSSSDDSEEEDFSLDVSVNNFQKPGDGDGIPVDDEENKVDADKRQPNPNAQGCGCDCYLEKGILVNEIERLRKAVFELSERHSVLEDFIEVEYSASFDKFLKNREHLVSMGFGCNDSEGSQDIIDGKRSSKSAELIELLKMIKEQATANEKDEAGGNSAAMKKPSSSSKGGNSAGQSNKSQQKPKSIPSVSSQRERDRGSGRGGALNYNQRPKNVPTASSDAYNFQYQQQLLAHQQETQARQYYESLYGRDSRDFISVVGRTELYPRSSASYGYGNGGRSDGGSNVNRASKKQRKRKRHSEVSSEASSASASRNIPNGGKSQPSGSSSKPAVIDDDIQELDSQGLNVNTKRICPLCEKIINRNRLRDHLSIVHQGHKVTCPVCQVEFLQRRRIKTHMRDAHDLPVSEYSGYIDKIYSNIEEQCGPWLDKLMKEAETPTKDQLLVHNAEIQMAILARREQKATESANQPAAVEREGVSKASTKQQAAAPSRSSAHSSSRSSSSRAANPSASSGGGRRDNRDRDTRDRGSRGGQSSYSSSQSQSVRYFTGANTKVSSMKGYGGSGRDNASAELYGPGGYAQYAARYLQQRAATGSGSGNVGGGRLYTPF